MVHRLRWIIAALVVLLASSVFAQSVTLAQVEWVGLLEAVDGQSITLQGQTLSISGAEVEATLEVGKLVKVEGQVAEDGTITIEEIYVPRKAIFGIKIEGVISAISAESLTINGLVIDLNGLKLSDDFAVGVLAKVQVDGTWAARQVALGGPEDASDDAKATPDPEATAIPDADSNDDGSSDDDERLSETVAFSAEQAIAAVLALYPDAFILEIEFYGATWEVRTTLYEIEISSSTGEVMRVEEDQDDDDSRDDGDDDSRDDGDDDSRDDGDDDSRDDGDDDSRDDGDDDSRDDGDDDSRDDGDDDDDD